MKDNTLFRNLRDSMMLYLHVFLKCNHNVPTHIIYAYKILPYYFIRSEHIVSESLDLKTGVPEHVIPNILELQSDVR